VPSAQECQADHGLLELTETGLGFVRPAAAFQLRLETKFIRWLADFQLMA